MPTLQSHLTFHSPYYTINREERNVAAIFYHSLLLGENLMKFLDLIGYKQKIVEDEIAIYYEYAFLRDLWKNISKQHKEVEVQNKIKQNFILDFLDLSNKEELASLNPYEFNNYFGAGRAPSSTYIASPSNWSIRYFDKKIQDDEEFRRVCEFKWCFNAKPDIVIHTSNKHAVCIEVKFERGEGQYPSSDIEKKIFRQRFDKKSSGKGYLIGQLSIQEKLMRELLGIETQFVFLVQKKGRSKHNGIDTFTWKEVFARMDIGTCPKFIQEWIGQLEG